MRPDTIVLHGNNVDSNRGCQALRWTTDLILDRYLPGQRRLHANIFRNDHPQFPAGQTPDRAAEQLWEAPPRGGPRFCLWGTPVVCSRLAGRFPRMKVHRALDRAAALVALGGDNLSYDYGFLATLLFFSPLAAAVRKTVPTAIWAASVGPFGRRPRWEKRFADLLRRVDLITVREPHTQEYLDGLGIRGNVHRVTDPAFLLAAAPTELPEPLEQALRAGAIGINLAPLMIRYRPGKRDDWFRHAIGMVSEVRRKTNLPIVLVPHVMMPSSVFPDNDDYAFMRRVWQSLPTEIRDGVLVYDARQDTCRQIKWVISRLRAYAGSRLHSAIAALSSGVPTFCIGYSVKARGIMQDVFGHESWCAHVSELAAEPFAERIQALLAAETDIRRHLQTTMPAYAERAWQSGALLAKIVR